MGYRWGRRGGGGYEHLPVIILRLAWVIIAFAFILSDFIGKRWNRSYTPTLVMHIYAMFGVYPGMNDSQVAELVALRCDSAPPPIK